MLIHRPAHPIDAAQGWCAPRQCQGVKERFSQNACRRGESKLCGGMVILATGVKGAAASFQMMVGSSMGMALARVRGCTMKSNDAPAPARWRARLSCRKLGVSVAVNGEGAPAGRAEYLQASPPTR